MTAASTTTLPPSVETLREQLDDAAKHIGEQRERIKALEAALRPFADEAACYARNTALNEYPNDFLACVQLGDIRKALSVLSGEAK